MRSLASGGSGAGDMKAVRQEIFQSVDEDLRRRWWNQQKAANKTALVPKRADWPTAFRTTAWLRALFMSASMWYGRGECVSCG